MDQLIAFVTARLDEREQWIRRFAQLLAEVHLQNANTPEHQRATIAFVFGQEHADPGLLLGDVAAKRKLIAAYEKAEQAQPSDSWESDYTQGLRDAVMILAEAWSDHPDYLGLTDPDPD